MTKIEEIFQKHIDPHNQVLEHLYFKKIKGYEAIEDAMKEYAEWYARKCLEIAESHIFEEVYCAEIYPTEIKLPPHD